jgi:hypothetical protein
MTGLRFGGAGTRLKASATSFADSETDFSFLFPTKKTPSLHEVVQTAYSVTTRMPVRVERLAVDLAKDIFGAQSVYGSSASKNILEPALENIQLSPHRSQHLNHLVVSS